MAVLRSRNEVEGLRLAGDLVACIFEMLRRRVRPGVRLDELDRAVEDFLRAHGAESPYKGYRPTPSVPPFPGTVCASVNEQVVHGISSRRKLRGGGHRRHRRGGRARRLDRGRLLHVPRGGSVPEGEDVAGCVEGVPGGGRGGGEARRTARGRGGGHPGGGGAPRLRRGAAARGHGVGRKLHEEPHVEHFGRRGRGLRLREGMVFTVEPMINEGGREIRMLGDGWTVVTADGTLSAQYEHTVVVTAEGCEILTPWHRYVYEGAASV